MKKVKFAKVAAIAEAAGVEARTQYFGRCFAGEAVGFVVDHWSEDAVFEAIKEAGATRIFPKYRAKYDSMGRKSIVYWEYVTCPDAPSKWENEED